ncbi:hypothetical protein B9479_006031, partial [Cryptococcus floricola]
MKINVLSAESTTSPVETTPTSDVGAVVCQADADALPMVLSTTPVFIYARINDNRPTAKVHKVCIDSGASISVMDRRYARENFPHLRSQSQPGLRITGLGTSQTVSTHFLLVDVLCNSLLDDEEMVLPVKFHLIDDLATSILVGNDVPTALLSTPVIPLVAIGIRQDLVRYRPLPSSAPSAPGLPPALPLLPLCPQQRTPLLFPGPRDLEDRTTTIRVTRPDRLLWVPPPTFLVLGPYEVPHPPRRYYDAAVLSHMVIRTNDDDDLGQLMYLIRYLTDWRQPDSE